MRGFEQDVGSGEITKSIVELFCDAEKPIITYCFDDVIDYVNCCFDDVIDYVKSFVNEYREKKGYPPSSEEVVDKVRSLNLEFIDCEKLNWNDIRAIVDAKRIKKIQTDLKRAKKYFVDVFVEGEENPSLDNFERKIKEYLIYKPNKNDVLNGFFKKFGFRDFNYKDFEQEYFEKADKDYRAKVVKNNCFYSFYEEMKTKGAAPYVLECLKSAQLSDCYNKFFNSDGYKRFCITQKIIESYQNRDVKVLMNLSGLSNKEFAYAFKVPLRTVQSWRSGKRNPPNYQILWLGYIMLMHPTYSEKYINENPSEIVEYQDVMKSCVVEWASWRWRSFYERLFG